MDDIKVEVMRARGAGGQVWEVPFSLQTTHIPISTSTKPNLQSG